MAKVRFDDFVWGKTKKDSPRLGRDEVQNPLTRRLDPSSLAALVRPLIAKGVGDGSIAVRLNRQGIECSRADIVFIRTGRRPAQETGGSFDF